MKVKGKIGVMVTEDMVREPRWFELINYDEFIDKVPFCPRPKGGSVRYNFRSYADLEDKAQEIREAAKYIYKHEGDVHRNAHFIGMSMLYHIRVSDKNHLLQERVFHSTIDKLQYLDQKKFLRDKFQEFFDRYVQEFITEDELITALDDITEAIKDERLQTWFVKDCDKKMNSELILMKTKHKLNMRKKREMLRDEEEV